MATTTSLPGLSSKKTHEVHHLKVVKIDQETFGRLVEKLKERGWKPSCAFHGHDTYDSGEMDVTVAVVTGNVHEIVQEEIGLL